MTSNRKDAMLVRDVMSRRPWTVGSGTSVTGALRLLAEHRVTSLPVIDARRRLIGVVSEADLIRRALVADPRAQETPREDAGVAQARTVDEVMTRDAVTTRESADLLDVVALITARGFKSLPVVDPDDHVVGMVSRSDVVRALARSDEALRREVGTTLGELGHADWHVEATDGVVAINGPRSPADVSLARSAAHSVPGVVEVRIG